MSTVTKRRRRRSGDEWQRLIDEQAASGQTQSAFCAAHGISVASLQYWKRRLGAPATTPEPWLELGTLAEASAARWDVELDLGDGIVLRLRRC
jgi:transposase-like protein